MQKSGKGRLYSASDLVSFAACAHLTHLDLANLETPLVKAEDTDEMVLLQDKGFEHEARYLDLLTRQRGAVTDLKIAGASDEVSFRATLDALRRGDQVLFQATFLSAPWVGHADFLTRVDTPSSLGDFSYEVVDTKLARSSKAKFLLQLCFYSELLCEVQGVMPRHMHVVLGDGRKDSFHVDDYLRYYRQLKSRFLTWVNAHERDSYPERNERCSTCRWRELCGDQWVRDDHMNRVANISRVQIQRLQEAGIGTMHDLARLPADFRVARIQPATRQRLAHQACLQVQSDQSGQPVFEILSVVEGKGFNRLPEPAEGDLYFDMEGDPLEDGGLEYLFGVYLFERGERVFKPFWAHSRSEEKLAFEAFMDFSVVHLARWPRAHIYHYASYEQSALKRLMSLHGTREEEVDNLLRQHKLVDLYAVVREGLRVGEPGYSIKNIERFYGHSRQGDVKTAGASIVFYEQWKATGDESLLKAIEDYNCDDVRSTYELREWLLKIRPSEANWPVAHKGAEERTKPLSKAASKAVEAFEEYRSRLLDGLPDDRLSWTPEQRLRELLFQLLSFHRRTDKPVWWALFDRQQASEEELLDDIEALAGLVQSRTPQEEADGVRYWYSFPEQECKLKTGDSCTVVETMDEATGVVIDEEACEVSFFLEASDPLPTSNLALGAGRPFDSRVIQGAIRRFVDAYLEGSSRYTAGLALLRRSAPMVAGHEVGEPLIAASESLLEGSIRVVSNLMNSLLFIQGPPGAGKTYTGSHVIVELLRSGKTVGVTSNSHKAINNLLQGVERVASSTGLSFCGAKKSSSEESSLKGKFIEDVFNTQALIRRISSFQLLAGTAWFFSSSKLGQVVDYLVVDEAGQVSLANLIAMSTCAKNLVLLGDQMQLGQPIQGVHPGESGESTLDYLLQGEATIAPHLGVFLKDTWRMHPDVCAFISDAVYDGRLEAEAGNSNQRLLLAEGAHAALRPTGVNSVAVEHNGCSQRSDEEAETIRRLFESLLKQRYVDRNGVERAMDLHNILVVAPYNLQVNRLKQVLPEGARVGTVDKFQGQEAEVVLVSMTTSSGEYLPRNIEFLYSKNRLNVAISRAKCFSVVVASPRLSNIECKSPEQMALVNTLCWVLEYSQQQ